MVKAVRHTGIVVSNLEEALHFYRDLLGLKIVKDADESGDYIDNMLSLKKVRVRTIKMADDDGNLIELLYFQSHSCEAKKDRHFYEIGVSHVAFTVEDIDATYRKLKEEGVFFNAAPQYSPDGYAKVTFCKDPDDSLVELVEVLK